MGQLHSPQSLERGLQITLLRLSMAGETSRLKELICEEVDSDGSDEKHEWLGQAPQVDEFKGSRKYTPMTAGDVTIPNVPYDGGVLVNRDEFADNRSGSVRRRLNDLARNATQHPNKLITSKLDSGTTDTTTYDGVAFFSDSHPARADEGGTQDNLLAGSGTSTANVAADMNTGLAALMGFLAENGEPFHGDGEPMLHAVAPWALRKAFKEALEAMEVSSTSNRQMGLADVSYSARLSDANDWYLCVVDPGRKPLIWQNREPISTDSTMPGTERWTDKRQAAFGVAYRAGCGYGLWQSAVKFVNS